MYLLVDPIVLCLPDQRATSDQIAHFIKHLIAWDKFIRNDSADQFCITARCYSALLDAGRYPSPKLMARLIDKRTDLPVNGNDVYNACRRIIETACFPSFEDIVDLPLDEFDSGTVNLDPDLLERIPPEIKESFRKTFGYVAYAKDIQNNTIASNLLLLTHPIEEDKIAIDINLLVIDDDNLNQVRVETDLPIAETPQDLLKLRNLTDIWENTRQAIDWVQDKHNINADEKSTYTVSPEFNESLEKCQFHTHPPLLNQCFQTIALLLAKKRIQDNQQFRTSKGGNSKQVEIKVGENTWKAWRVRINKSSGAEYRLHYWRHGDKYFFSNVVSKNDDIRILGVDEEIVSQIK